MVPHYDVHWYLISEEERALMMCETGNYGPVGFIVSFFLIYLANEKLLHPIILAYSIVIFVYEFSSESED